MEAVEHLQRAVGQDHLLRADLPERRRSRGVLSPDEASEGQACPTWTPSSWDSCVAFWCLRQLPAFVTNTTGNRKWLFLSTSFRNAR